MVDTGEVIRLVELGLREKKEGILLHQLVGEISKHFLVSDKQARDLAKIISRRNVVKNGVVHSRFIPATRENDLSNIPLGDKTTIVKGDELDSIQRTERLNNLKPVGDIVVGDSIGIYRECTSVGGRDSIERSTIEEAIYKADNFTNVVVGVEPKKEDV